MPSKNLLTCPSSWNNQAKCLLQQQLLLSSSSSLCDRPHIAPLVSYFYPPISPPHFSNFFIVQTFLPPLLLPRLSLSFFFLHWRISFSHPSYLHLFLSHTKPQNTTFNCHGRISSICTAPIFSSTHLIYHTTANQQHDQYQTNTINKKHEYV